MASEIKKGNMGPASVRYLSERLEAVSWQATLRAGRVLVVKWENPLIGAGEWNHYVDVNRPEKEPALLVRELATIVLHVAGQLVCKICDYERTSKEMSLSQKLLLSEV